LVLDGVFAAAGDPSVSPAAALTAADVADVLATLVPRLVARQARRG
jgi:hypothetical protein